MKAEELMIEKESWKDIPGYEGLYMASDNGRIKTVPHIIHKGSRFEHTTKEHIVKVFLTKDGYSQVFLCKNGIMKSHRLHRLIATTFIPNPFDLPEVNHKDENKKNNNVNNLEWCTKAYNTKYGTRTQRTSKRIVQLTQEGRIVNLFNSVREAGRKTGIPTSNIRNCANGRIIHPKGKSDYIIRSAGGYKWAYCD